MSDEKIFAALSYVFPIFGGILVFFLRKGNYERFHAMQSVLLWIIVIVASIIIDIAIGIFWIIPIIGGIIGPILSIAKMIFGLVVFICWLILIWKAFIGEKIDIPVISEKTREMKTKAEKSI